MAGQRVATYELRVTLRAELTELAEGGAEATLIVEPTNDQMIELITEVVQAATGLNAAVTCERVDK